MSVQVRIPAPLRELTQNKEVVSVAGGTIAELLTNLDSSYRGMKDRICDEKGNVRRFVNIFVNEEDIRFLDNLQTPLQAGDNVSILPAIAGG